MYLCWSLFRRWVRGNMKRWFTAHGRRTQDCYHWKSYICINKLHSKVTLRRYPPDMKLALHVTQWSNGHRIQLENEVIHYHSHAETNCNVRRRITQSLRVVSVSEAWFSQTLLLYYSFTHKATPVTQKSSKTVFVSDNTLSCANHSFRRFCRMWRHVDNSILFRKCTFVTEVQKPCWSMYIGT